MTELARSEIERPDALEVPAATIDDYRTSLRTFDASICEALAVGQATSDRIVAPHAGYATRVFARLCSHGVAIIRSCPKTRWVHSDAENWDFGSIASHFRSIMEGRLLFDYISKEPESDEEWSARLNVMHLNDCTRRIRILRSSIDEEKNRSYEAQAEELRDRLRSNLWFCALDEKLKKKLITGDLLTISARSEQLSEIGWDTQTFFALFDFLSQYIHVLPLSFYNTEPNGRGTGLENDTDRTYISQFLLICSEMLDACTGRMVDLFPDAAAVRQGSDSKFSPGPRRNLPRHRKRRS